MTRTLVAVLVVAALAAGAGCKSKQKHSGALARAQAAYDAGEYDTCIELCDGLVASMPGPAQLLRGKAYERKNDLSHAIADYEQARRYEGVAGEAAFRQIRALLALGQFEPAETVSEWAVTQIYDSLSSREQMMAHAMYGEVHLATGRFPSAAEAFEAALKVAQSSGALAQDLATGVIYYNLSRANFERHSFRRARETYVAYLDLVRRAGTEPEADDLYTLGVLHFLCNDIRAAREVGGQLPGELQARLTQVLNGDAFSIRALYEGTRPEPQENR
jgi:tetratricopeptide (TPR) repeat protein